MLVVQHEEKHQIFYAVGQQRVWLSVPLETTARPRNGKRPSGNTKTGEKPVHEKPEQGSVGGGAHTNGQILTGFFICSHAAVLTRGTVRDDWMGCRDATSG